jgi:hypothetical protein
VKPRKKMKKREKEGTKEKDNFILRQCIIFGLIK